MVTETFKKDLRNQLSEHTRAWSRLGQLDVEASEFESGADDSERKIEEPFIALACSVSMQCPASLVF